MLLNSLARLRRSQFLVVVIASVLACGSGTASAQTTFSNSNQIMIGPNAAASPYPSTITASGLTGNVSTVSVTLNNLTNSSVGDVGVLLVGPTGAAFLIQGEMGGSNSISNVTYTLSDAAATALPTSSAWSAGTFKPSASSTPSFASSAPASYNASATAGAATFSSTFGGTAPNGTWSLYVESFSAGSSGQFAGGWSVTITTAAQVPASIAKTSGDNQQAIVNQSFATDLSVTVKDAANAVIPNQSVTFTAPASGASGTFANSTSTTTVNTNSSGVATASVFTANSQTGSYNVTATAGTLQTSFSLANNPVPPTVTGVSSTVANSTYGVAAVIPITIAFSAAVTVTGTPELALNSGGTASYSSGSGTSTLTFTYTVAAGQNSALLDYTSTSALSLNGGAIDGAGSNAAVLTLPAPGAAGSLGANKSIVIDTTSPTVTGVSSTTVNGTYGTGAVISITIGFSKSVTVTGTPQLALNSGGTANYSSGSGTSTLTFSYTVAAGENSAKLDYTSTSALSLNGGTIDGAGSNAADVTLPAPGATGSLAANKNIVIDTASPTVVSFNVVFGTQSYNLIGSARTRVPWQVSGIKVTFSKAIATADQNSLTGVTTTSLSGVGTNTLTWAINPIALGNVSAVLKGTGANAIKDASDNALAGGTDVTQNFKVLLGDFNDDGFVNSLDTVSVYGSTAQPYNIFADLNGDGVVDLNDAALARSNLGASQP